MPWDRRWPWAVVPCAVVAFARGAFAQEGPDAGAQAERASVAAREEPAECLLGIDPGMLHFEAGPVRLRLGAYAAAAWTRYGRVNLKEDGPACTDVRPTLGATWDDVSLRVEADAFGTDTPHHLYEAWAAWQPSPAARVTAGLFRVALNSEFATHEADLPLVGYGFPSHLDGRHDLGVRVDGRVLEDAVWYEAAAVTGHGFDLEGHRKSSPQGSLRLTCAPSRLLANPGPLRGLHFGIAAARVGDGDGDDLIVTTPLESRVVDIRDLDGRSGHWVHWEAGWAKGPFQIGYEYAFGGTRDVRFSGGRTDVDDLRASSWFAAWNLTGEERGWGDGRLVSRMRDPENACRFLPPGRWVLTGRFSTVEVGRDIFNVGLARRDPSAWETMTYSLGLTWEPSPAVRLGVGMVKTVAEDQLTTFGGTKRDTALVLRAELRF
jgi:hypothetical protein